MHLAAVVALPTGVLQGVKGDLRVLVQEHLELASADAQIILIELIGNVPSYWTKLAPFLQLTTLADAREADITMLLHNCTHQNKMHINACTAAGSSVACMPLADFAITAQCSISQ